MSGHAATFFTFEVGKVYVRKNRLEKAQLRHGRQANRYDGNGRWTFVYGFEDDQGLSWLTLEERELRLSKESVKGVVYTERTNLKRILNPSPLEQGWQLTESAKVWQQREQVVYFQNQWLPYKSYESMMRQPGRARMS